ncbi:cytochrome P450 [Streptomyces sp. 4N509B]|uniref:cytochrome P450 n=1 Tax=Streptomyces sp. 4N509B TaxID=3457413 RepID=UPI003FD37CBF
MSGERAAPTPPPTHPARPTPLPRAGPGDAARVLTRVVLPALAEGLIARRPRAMAWAQRRQADRAAIEVVRRLRARHGDGPLRLPVPGRSVALLLAADDVARVLRATPEPFSPATREKRGALEQFQPHGVLISRGEARAVRRRVNEAALDSGRPMHALAGPVVARVRREATGLTRRAAARGLGWEEFSDAWWRSVRRIVLGDAAADERALTDRLDRLRAAANWSLLVPVHRRRRAEFLRRLRALALAAPPDTLAGRLLGDEAEAAAREAEAAARGGDDALADPVGQIPHWLFAFDAAGAATLRTLALLAAHPAEAARVRAEVGGVDLDQPQPLPLLRACVLEAVRLWPTTPLLLRESTADTAWYGTTIPAGTAFAVFTPYFHRADPSVATHGDGDAFVPDIWLDGRAERNPVLVPFSAGPGRCPGENVVLLTATTWLAALLARHTYLPRPPTPLRPHRPIPATIDHFALRFSVRPG